jgi:PQQ-dependent dehydrogenase (methanol/ethanol family)
MIGHGRNTFALALGILAAAMLFPLSSTAQTDLATMSQNDKNWVMAGKNYDVTRFSNLNQINASTVSKLAVAWTFSVGAAKGQEEAPLVIDGTMYLMSSYPNRVFALDAATGDLKWTYVPNEDPAAQGEACCDVVTRGIGYDNGKIFIATLDGHAVSLDAKTGKELWVNRVADIHRGETITMAPLMVKGKMLVGVSGGEMGVRGWLAALDENSGKLIWREFSTGPDQDVGIGNDFHPFYSTDKGKDLGVTSWPADKWKIGGGPVWGWISYDPKTNLIFYGTGNPGPWNSNQREGDNKWTSTIMARDPDNGHLMWADQIGPHDLWDYDEVNENVLVTLPIQGQNRDVLIHVGRDGYMYVIDRRTGQIYSAVGYDEGITSTKGVDLKTGRLIPNPDKHPDLGRDIEDVCPASPGAKDWEPSAWSPVTHLLYVPHQHVCMNFKTSEVGYIAGTPYMGATVDMYAGQGGYRGEFMAWDPVKQQKVWADKEKVLVWSGALVTAGNVAFYGTTDRMFKAVDARTGKLLWQFRAGSGIIGQPITYQGSDGRQYVAIATGIGGWPGVTADAEVDARVRNGALGFVGASQDLPAYTSAGGSILVFALPPDVVPNGGSNAPQR